MASSDRGVPRGDHVPAAEQDQSIEKQEANTRGEGVQAHAASSREPHREVTPEPDFTKGTDRGGSAGWGSEASGGSVIDKRGPES
jgi:hypothetical protein